MSEIEDLRAEVRELRAMVEQLTAPAAMSADGLDGDAVVDRRGLFRLGALGLAAGAVGVAGAAVTASPAAAADGLPLTLGQANTSTNTTSWTTDAAGSVSLGITKNPGPVAAVVVTHQGGSADDAAAIRAVNSNPSNGAPTVLAVLSGNDTASSAFFADVGGTSGQGLVVDQSFNGNSQTGVAITSGAGSAITATRTNTGSSVPLALLTNNGSASTGPTLRLTQSGTAPGLDVGRTSTIAANPLVTLTNGSSAPQATSLIINNTGGSQAVSIARAAGSPAATLPAVTIGNLAPAQPTVRINHVIGSTVPALDVLQAGTGAAGSFFGNGDGVITSAGGNGVVTDAGKIGVIADGNDAPIRLVPRGTAGRPTTGTHSIGEMVVDVDGRVFVNTSATGNGIWRRILTAQTDYDNNVGAGTAGFAGGVNLLTVPWRVFDSRPGQPVPIGNSGQKLQPNVNLSIGINGTPPDPSAIGAVPIPDGAVGFLVGITVTETVGAGFVKLFPAGQTPPNTSVVNWSAAGQIQSATTIVRCDTQGSITLRAGVNATHCVLDLIGFLA